MKKPERKKERIKDEITCNYWLGELMECIDISPQTCKYKNKKGENKNCKFYIESTYLDLKAIGYNHACDDWEEFLPDIDEIARLMHDEYEKQAKIIGWKTQESCQVKFDDLPKNNKKVMYKVAEAISKRIRGEE